MITLLLSLAFVGYVVLGVMTLYGNWRQLSNLLFAAISLCFAAWTLSIMLFDMTDSSGVARVCSQLFYFSAASFAALFALFTLYYPRNQPLKTTTILTIFIPTSVMLALLAIDNSFMITELVKSDGSWHVTVNSIGQLIYITYFVILFCVSVIVSVLKFYEYRGVERLRASVYVFGIILSSIPGFIVNLYLPFTGNYNYIWLGPLASLMFLVAAGYSIIRHKMFDVKEVFVKSMVYILLIASIALIYSSTLYFVKSILVDADANTATGFMANLVVALVIAFSFQPLRRLFDAVTSKIFYRDQYDLSSMIDTISMYCVEATDMETLCMQVESLLGKVLQPEFCGIVFEERQRLPIVLGKMPTQLNDTDVLSAQIEREWNHTSDGAAVLKKSRVYRIATASQQLGYLVIGQKMSKRTYSQMDSKLLAFAVGELSIAMQNMYRLEEIRAFAQTLEKEVSDATRDLRRSNKRLLLLDATKDEFVSMASHQLRTPLTSVKGYISMVLEGDAGDISESQRQLLNEAFTSSERMVHLIGDFLNVSRLQTGKFMLDTHPIDLTQIVAEEVESMTHIAETHDMRLRYRAPSRFPRLELDEGKLRQVIMNFIDNAIYYSHAGDMITVALTTVDGEVVFTVKDHGIGVPKEVQERLFSKFFRADNAKTQRPDGTGIGLYLAQKIITAHGGSMVFESIEGKGSTFGFRLPIKKLSV